MKKFQRYLSIASLAIASLTTGNYAIGQAVHAWEGTISIPTYKLGPADPNPPFPLVTKAPVYPYTMLDNLTSDRVTQTYKAIYLENQYLKITVLPQLGGHVYSVYDKVDGREVLYRDHVIKYGLVGARGAWIAGGMEFSFPYAHTTDTISPVESVLKQNPDGSATAVVGAIDWVSNMHWEIALTLRPDTARVEEGVTLFNSTPRNHLYLFWTNAAVRATDDTHYIYPMRETIDDDPFSIVQSWPNWHGVDESWYKNDPSALAIFGRDVQRNFFGVYYSQSNYGVVHVADYRVDPGKKLWTWGTAPSGKIWDNILSDNDGAYNEIQSGRFYTQGNREFMNPGSVESWTEYWYPVRGLDGGFVEATSQMAINPTYSQGDKPEVKVTVSPVAAVSGAILNVRQGSKLLKQFRGLDFTPLQPSTYTVALQDVEEAKKNLDIEIQSAQGKVLLHWSAAAPIDGNPDFVPSAGKALAVPIRIDPDTPVEQIYMQALFLEKTGNLQGAMKVYDQALERDPGYVPALLQEAWYRYSAAEFKQAEDLIARAMTREKQNPSISYTAGVVERADGQLSLAKDAFWDSIHNASALPAGPSLAASYLNLGEIAICQQDYEGAITLLQEATKYNPGDGLALADLALSERLAGNSSDAAKYSTLAIDKMPLLPDALAEGWQDNLNSPAATWTQTISSDPENYLAVASWYHSMGAWKSSDAVLRAAIEHVPSQDLSPMVYYYLSANARSEGDAAQAEENARKAASISSAQVFPNRLNDAAVLESAIRQNPADGNAKYALGNFLFAHARYEEAASLWQSALDEGMKEAVLLRNLGVYQWRIKKNLAAASALYERAIRLSPKDYRLYTSLDEIYEAQGNAEARVKLFQNAPPDVLEQDTIRARRAILSLEQSRPDAALALINGHVFKPWEGGVSIHNLFVDAYMKKGESALGNQNPKEASEDFRNAMRFPESLGTGEPAHPDDSEQLYWLGNALAAQGKHADATAAWEQATRQNTLYSALSAKKLGQDQQASQALESIIQAAAKPQASSGEIYAAGQAERYSGRTEQARIDFERALKLDPDLWQARIALNALNAAAKPTA